MKKKFIVYIGQVNQSSVEVYAEDESEAREKGYAKWRRENAHTPVTYVEECDSVDETSEGCK